MRLCFLMGRQYAPYPKWFGTAFKGLSCAEELSPILRRVQLATTWREREEQYCTAGERIAAMLNALGVIDPVPAAIQPFFTRPYRVIDFDPIPALRAAITDPAVKRIASKRLIGGIDQFSDSTDLVADSRWRPVLRSLYSI